MSQQTCDVAIIGGGSAAFEAAVAARQAGADKVVMLEKADESTYGGNARFSHTGFRFVFSGPDEVIRAHETGVIRTEQIEVGAERNRF